MKKKIPFYDQIDTVSYFAIVRQSVDRLILLRWVFRFLQCYLLGCLFREKLQTVLLVAALWLALYICDSITSITKCAAVDIMRMRQFNEFQARQKADYE